MNARKLMLMAAVSYGLAVTAAAGAELSVDAVAQPEAPRSSHLKMGTGAAPDGTVLGVNNHYLTRNGRPFLPVMGEFHYTRYPAQYWDEEMAKMKASGIEVVACYVIWSHHEERAGEFNWSGQRDLRRFVETAKRNGLDVVIRIGPWAHGEVRFGGTPDWVVNAMPTRGNDPTYMKYVERYWTEVAKQVKGEFWKDGGPIVGVQLENEYNRSGPGQGPAHIAALKALALKLGFDAPYYTVTGWDDAVYPRGEVLPVFAGYPDEPWSRSAERLPPKEVYTFRFNSRTAGNVGAQTLGRAGGTIAQDMADTPFLGAEYGGGVPIMYRRRPLIMPDDIGAMLPVQLGSGANLYGYYMYHGGQNPQSYPTLEEDSRLGGYNDMPILNYDFQAPLGQYGEVHPVMGKIRPYHLFLNAFGDRLAPMMVHQPPIGPQTREDVSTPRYSVRSAGDSGFVFFNNYVRQFETPAQKDTTFKVALPSGPLSFPSRPVDIPSGAYFIWPFNMDLDGARLAWATAQPVTRIEDAGVVTYVFAETGGVPVELAFDGKAGVVRHGRRTLRPSADGRVVVRDLKPGTGEALRVTTPAGKTVSIVVLAKAEVEQLSRLPIGGREHLVLSPDAVFATEEGLTARSVADPDFRLAVFPALAAAPTATLPLTKGQDGLFQTWSASARPRTLTVKVEPLREAQAMPRPNTGGPSNAAVQPYPEAYGRSGAWTLTLPEAPLDGLSDAYLKIDYAGDVGRLFNGVDMLDDHFFYGTPWNVGLKRYSQRLTGPLTLTVLPLRSDAAVYIEPQVKPAFPASGQIAEVRKVELIPEYELKLSAGR